MGYFGGGWCGGSCSTRSQRTEALGSARICSDPLGFARVCSDLLGSAHSALAHTLSKFYRMMYSKKVKAAVRKRAHQRWWALMHRVEVSNGMRDHLGDTGWVRFKGFCIDHFRHSFLALFDPCGGVLRCSGPLCGGPCPHNHQVDFAAATALRQMEALHLDHAFDVQHICELWKQLTPRDPVSWDQGIKGMLVAHLLFGTRNLGGHPPNIGLRCGISRGIAQPMHRERVHLCHKQHGAHYTHVLHPDVIRDLPTPKRLRPCEVVKCIDDPQSAKRQRVDASAHHHEVCEIEVIVID